MSDVPPQLSPAIILEHADGLRALVSRLVLDDSRVDDVLQETWITAMRSPPRSEAAFGSWLRKVAVRLAGKARRAEATRNRHERGVESSPAMSQPEDIVQREMARRHVVDAVLALREPYRSTVLYRFFENLSSREIAERLELPVETVRTRLKRGLAQLRDKMDAAYGGDPNRWHMALLPLALAPFELGAAAAAAGGAAWGLLAWLKVLAAAVLIGFGGWLAVERLTAPPPATASVAFTEDELEPVDSDAEDAEVSDLLDEDDAAQREIADVEIRMPPVSPEPMLAVTGRVVDGGRGVAGAHVSMFLRPRMPGFSFLAFRSSVDPCRLHRVERTVVTGVGGRFAFRGPAFPYSTVQVMVEHGRHAPAMVKANWDATAGPLALADVELAEGGRVFGAVTLPTGAPAAGARVSFRASLRGYDPRRTNGFDRVRLASLVPPVRTDAAGRFELAHVPPRVPFVVAVDDVPGCVPTSAMGDALRNGEVVDCGELRLDEGVALVGRVLNRDGEPVAGASIVGAPRSPRSGERRPPSGGQDFERRRIRTARATTDADGRFDLGPYAGGLVRLSVAHDDYNDVHRDVSWPRSDPIELRLEPRSAVRVVVVDEATGAPIERFGVQAREWHRSRFGRDSRRDRGGRRGPPDSKGRTRGGGGERGRRGGGRSRESFGWRPSRRRGPSTEMADHEGGVAAMTGLQSGRYVFAVSAPGYVRGESEPIDVETGVSGTTVRVAMRRGSRIGGLVRDARTGDAIAGARVELLDGRAREVEARRQSSDFVFGRRFAVAATDTSGAFALGAHRPGSYALRVHAPGYQALVRAGVHVAAGADASDLEIELGPGSRLFGVVRGAPAGEKLLVVAAGEGAPHSAPVDETGRYEMTGMSAGRYGIYLVPRDLDESAGRHVSSFLWREREHAPDVVVLAGADRQFNLDARSFALPSVRGRVLRNGLPTAGFAVRLREQRGDTRGGSEKRGSRRRGGSKSGPSTSRVVETGDDGSFSMPAVPPGEYELSVTSRATGRGTVLHREGVVVARGGVVERALRLVVGAARIEVRDVSGKPVDGRVRLVLASGADGVAPEKWSRLPSYQSCEFQRGIAEIDDVPPGDYAVHFSGSAEGGVRHAATGTLTVTAADAAAHLALTAEPKAAGARTQDNKKR